MTAKRGTLWKTSWRRQKPVVTPNPLPMWFFTNFGGFSPNPFARYAFPNPSPATGEFGPPFWVGMVTAYQPASLVGNTIAAFAGSGGLPGRWLLQTNMVNPNDAAVSVVSVGGNVLMNASAPTLNATYRAVVMLATFVTSGGVTTGRLWVDGNPVVVDTSPTPLPIAAIIEMFARTTGYIHGWAGGNVAPTNAEIQSWFFNTKNNQEIAEIPGKTLDRFSATSVQPAVPNPLPTLGTGQNMDYQVVIPPDPVAQNVFIPVSFGY